MNLIARRTPSSQSDVVENSDSKWWWVSVLREAVEAVTGNTLCSSFPQRPLRVLSCCTGCSAESEVLKAGFGLGSRGLSPYCLASLESSDTSGEQKPEPERKSLISLGVKTVGHRIRICKGSILSAGLWGHQAIGVSPKRRKWYRTMCAQHLGRQALGSLDLTFAMFSSRCEDPHFTILRQHFRAVARVFASWTERDPAKLESTWTSLWHHLSNVPYFWRRVTGPISATICVP